MTDYLTKMGFLMHCLLLPVIWGLTVEWLFHVVRTRGGGNDAGPAPDIDICEPDGWSCQL